MFVERWVSYSQCQQKMMPFGGQASFSKMTSNVVKLLALVCHPTKEVNKAEALTSPSKNIANLYLFKHWAKVI